MSMQSFLYATAAKAVESQHNDAVSKNRSKLWAPTQEPGRTNGDSPQRHTLLTEIVDFPCRWPCWIWSRAVRDDSGTLLASWFPTNSQNTSSSVYVLLSPTLPTLPLISAPHDSIGCWLNSSSAWHPMSFPTFSSPSGLMRLLPIPLVLPYFSCPKDQGELVAELAVSPSSSASWRRDFFTVFVTPISIDRICTIFPEILVRSDYGLPHSCFMNGFDHLTKQSPSFPRYSLVMSQTSTRFILLALQLGVPLVVRWGWFCCDVADYCRLFAFHSRVTAHASIQSKQTKLLTVY